MLGKLLHIQNRVSAAVFRQVLYATLSVVDPWGRQPPAIGYCSNLRPAEPLEPTILRDQLHLPVIDKATIEITLCPAFHCCLGE